MYSGNLILAVDGWNIKERDIRTDLEYSYRILSDQFTILEEKDFDYFDTLFEENQ